jgi:hypothetical protein
MCEATLRPIAATGARDDFQRARRRHLAARAWRLMARRHSPARLRNLGDIPALFWCPARLRPIPLDAIVGTVDATADFDADFRPATDRLSTRWQRVASAHHAGRPLPPIAVVERPDGYYVLDGRHRVSVARALGRYDIDAWASSAAAAPHTRRSQATTTERNPMTRLTRRLLHAVSRALNADDAYGEHVHFHAGDHGRPYVCENRRCSSPSLRVAPA